MRNNRLIKFFKIIHKWPSIVIALFALLFAFSGIILNHRQFFSGIDIPRKFLPPNYFYKNWNMSTIRGSLNLCKDTSLLYGNIGILKTNDDYRTFTDFNEGFPKGIDNQKIYSVAYFDKIFVAGTHFGLYKRTHFDVPWEKVPIPVENERIVDLEIKDDTLIVLSRDCLLKSADLSYFEKIQLPPSTDFEHKAGLFNTLWELHSGELLGTAGQLFVDLLGIVTILLSVTGLLHFFFPKMMKIRRNKEKSVKFLSTAKKTNLKWHNVVGYLFAIFLVMNTLAGIFLRPPLLLAIAKSKISIVPYTHLDTPNPWFDKLRRVVWDEDLKQFILSTSDGFYSISEDFNDKLEPIKSQPPVSVMGCNVLEKVTADSYLVGSFSGMYLWDINKGSVTDYFSKQPYIKPEGMSRPISDHMVAGLIKKYSGEEFWFDYIKGAIGMSPLVFPPMPNDVILKSPMSLWNVALEIHTGRIFEHLVGPFYILYVPLSGLCLIMVLISGFFLWWMAFRKNKGK